MSAPAGLEPSAVPAPALLDKSLTLIRFRQNSPFTCEETECRIRADQSLMDEEIGQYLRSVDMSQCPR